MAKSSSHVRSLPNPYRSIGLGQAAHGLAGVHANLDNLAGNGVAQRLAFAGDLEPASPRDHPGALPLTHDHRFAQEVGPQGAIAGQRRAGSLADGLRGIRQDIGRQFREIAATDCQVGLGNRLSRAQGTGADEVIGRDVNIHGDKKAPACAIGAARLDMGTAPGFAPGGHGNGNLAAAFGNAGGGNAADFVAARAREARRLAFEEIHDGAAYRFAVGGVGRCGDAACQQAEQGGKFLVAWFHRLDYLSLQPRRVFALTVCPARRGGGKYCRKPSQPCRQLPNKALMALQHRALLVLAWLLLLLDRNHLPKPANTIMNDRIGEHLKVQRSALNILVQRQEMIASNIANADTPHYKARDIDFKEALANRLAGGRGQNLGLALTSRGHIAGFAEASTPVAMKYRNEFQPGVDGNTVNMDVERAAFAETALRLEAALTFVRGSFKDMQTAMSQ